MRIYTGRIFFIAAVTAAAGTTAALSTRASGQTRLPYIYGISTDGETCGGPCGGDYICCRISTQPAPNP